MHTAGYHTQSQVVMEPYMQCTTVIVSTVLITTTTDAPKLVLKLMICCKCIVKFGILTSSPLLREVVKIAAKFAFGT